MPKIYFVYWLISEDMDINVFILDKVKTWIMIF